MLPLLRRNLLGLRGHRLKVLALLYRCGGDILCQVSFGEFETGFLLGCVLMSRWLVGEGPCLPHWRSLSLLVVVRGPLESTGADLEVMVVLEPVEELVGGGDVEF